MQQALAAAAVGRSDQVSSARIGSPLCKKKFRSARIESGVSGVEEVPSAYPRKPGGEKCKSLKCMSCPSIYFLRPSNTASSTCRFLKKRISSLILCSLKLKLSIRSCRSGRRRLVRLPSRSKPPFKRIGSLSFAVGGEFGSTTELPSNS